RQQGASLLRLNDTLFIEPSVDNTTTNLSLCAFC
ncbi:MAG: hypothetical protein ACJA0J_001846, partial [Bdellovibrionota bacterium]